MYASRSGSSPQRHAARGDAGYTSTGSRVKSGRFFGAGVSTKSLYKWRRELAGLDQPKMSADINALRQEVTRLNAALRRATEERDILKKAAVYFASQPE